MYLLSLNGFVFTLIFISRLDLLHPVLTLKKSLSHVFVSHEDKLRPSEILCWSA